MKHVDEYRDPKIVRELAQAIKAEAKRPMRFMELCGTHTMAIARHGLPALWPAGLEMVSGPGCPVCVTSAAEIDAAVGLASVDGLCVATFGDMIRVPGSGGSLAEARARGADVRVVYSALDAVKIAAEEPGRQVAFLGIGFETTAPTVAAAIMAAKAQGLDNFSILSCHKLLPPAMAALLAGPELGLDGFVCPGHVSTVIGAAPYQAAVDCGLACVITGFEPVDIMAGVLMLVRQVAGGQPKVEIQYARAVSPEGNPKAVELMLSVFQPVDSVWRGLGPIPNSGLALREEYADFDAMARFGLSLGQVDDPPGCRCGDVLRGLMKPPECALFGKACNPEKPVGPCMVSGEGSCAAWFRYRRED